MAEQHTLSSPVIPPNQTAFSIRFINLNWQQKIVHIGVEDNNGRGVSKIYDSTTLPTGETLMIALNKANLSTKSLIKRVFEQLATDGVLNAGSVTGSPD